MIRNAVKIVKICNNLIDSDTDEIWVDYKNKCFSLVLDGNIPRKFSGFPQDEQSIKGLLEYLSDNGYITFYSRDRCHFRLTYKSLYHRQLSSQKRRDYFLDSIFVPILVSLITTFLTAPLVPDLLLALSESLQALVQGIPL